MARTTRSGSTLHTLTPSRRGGFTLIELLVVISIIALLIGLLLPALASARASSRAAVCGSNLHQMSLAIDMYADDNRDFYPRALPLNNPENSDDSSEWDIPYDTDGRGCPFWQTCYPAMVLPYLGFRVNNSLDYGAVMQQVSEEQARFFDCPGNSIPASDVEKRKCGLPLDYGFGNWASQNKRYELNPQSQFLMSDATWALAYEGGSQGPNEDPDLEGWWVPFEDKIHPGEVVNVLRPDQSTDAMNKDEFKKKYDTADPPDDDI